MTNKQQINKFKDMAELASAAYGYFHLMSKKFKNKKEYDDRKNTKITLYDILDLTYKSYKAYIPSRLPTLPPETIGELDGDFFLTQAKTSLKKYDVLIHQPNTIQDSPLPCLVKKESKPTHKLMK